MGKKTISLLGACNGRNGISGTNVLGKATAITIPHLARRRFFFLGSRLYTLNGFGWRIVGGKVAALLLWVFLR